MARSYRSISPRPTSVQSPKPQSLVPLTALGAGLLNIIGGGVALKAWIFNAGQTYYEALFRGFWLSPGALQLSDATITAAGYQVLRDSTELSVIGLIVGLPAALLVSLIIYALVSLVGYSVKRFTSFKGLSPSAKAKWGRGYLLFVGTLTVSYLCLLLYVGLYQFPRAAQLAGEQRHIWFKQQMHSNCVNCPEWGGKKVKGVAIASDGKQTLIATLGGVKSLNQENLDQTWPTKGVTKGTNTLPSSRDR